MNVEPLRCSCGSEQGWNDYGDLLTCYRCKAPICEKCNLEYGGWCYDCTYQMVKESK